MGMKETEKAPPQKGIISNISSNMAKENKWERMDHSKGWSKDMEKNELGNPSQDIVLLNISPAGL